MSDWHLYILECADGTLYTGITTDVDRRVREHNGESSGGANYTRARRPVELVDACRCDGQSRAARAEAAFKSLSRKQKLRRLDEGLTPSTVDDLLEE